MRVKFSAELLKNRFKRINSWEPGKLYLVQTENDIDLAIGISVPNKQGQELRSACVVLTGVAIGDIVIDEVGETSMTAIELPAGWTEATLVLDACPEDSPVGPGSIGMLRARDTFFMLLRGTERGYKHAYLHFGELRIRDSDEDFVLRRSLVRIEHPALGA